MQFADYFHFMLSIVAVIPSLGKHNVLLSLDSDSNILLLLASMGIYKSFRDSSYSVMLPTDVKLIQRHDISLIPVRHISE